MSKPVWAGYPRIGPLGGSERSWTLRTGRTIWRALGNSLGAWLPPVMAGSPQVIIGREPVSIRSDLVS